MGDYKFLFAGMLLLGCSVDRNASEVQTKRAALSSTGFSAQWIQIQGPNNNDFFARPTLVSGYTSSSDRWWYICDTTDSATLLCTYRLILGVTSGPGGGMDSGWLGFNQIAPPAGLTEFVPQNSPALTTWVDSGGNTWMALAARVYENSWHNAVYIQLTENPFTQNSVVGPWYRIPSSSDLDNFANVGDISLVASGGNLYLFGIGGAVYDSYYGAYFDGPPYSGFYAQNSVANGFSNAGWTWAPLPGNGAFNTAITAAPLDGGGAIVVGVGTDGQAYGQEVYQGSWDGWWWVIGAGGTFSETITDTAFDPTGADVEVFGLGTDGNPYQGNYYNWSAFDGWYQMDATFWPACCGGPTGVVFGYSPAAFRPSGTNHIDLVELGSDWALYVNEFNGSPVPTE